MTDPSGDVEVRLKVAVDGDEDAGDLAAAVKRAADAQQRQTDVVAGLRAELDRLKAGQRAVAAAWADPAYRAAARDLDALTTRTRELVRAERERVSLGNRTAATMLGGGYADSLRRDRALGRQAAEVARREARVGFGVRREEHADGTALAEARRQERFMRDQIRATTLDRETAARARLAVASQGTTSYDDARRELATQRLEREAGRPDRAAFAAARLADVRTGAADADARAEAETRRREREADRADRGVAARTRLADAGSGAFGRDARAEELVARAERLAALGERAAGAAARTAVLPLGGVAEARQARETLRAEAAEQRARAGIDLGVRREALASGAFAADARADARLGRDQRAVAGAEDRTRRLAVAEERKAAAATGDLAREIREAEKVRRAELAAERAERRAALQAKYGGTLGGLADDAHRVAGSPLGRGTAAILSRAYGTAHGMTMSGFSGTTEWNRYQLQLTLISRELASVFKPALEAATGALESLTKWLRRLSGPQQNALMYGGMALAGGVAANGLSRSLTGYGLGGLALQGVGAASSLYEMYQRHKAPPLAAPPTLAKPVGTARPYLAEAGRLGLGTVATVALGRAITPAGGTEAAASRFGALRGRLIGGIGTVASGLGTVGAVAAGATAFKAQENDVVRRVRDVENQTSLSKVRTVGEATALASPFTGMAVGGLKLADEGYKRVARTLGMDEGTLTGGFYETAEERAKRTARGEEKRRDVTPDQVGWSDLGGQPPKADGGHDPVGRRAFGRGQAGQRQEHDGRTGPRGDGVLPEPEAVRAAG